MRTLPIAAAIVVAAGLCDATAAPSEAWARVPALPTACYQNDGFPERLASAREKLDKDLERQRKINDELGDKVKSLDMMELASLQQQYMMDHPQEAMQIMQRNQQLGQTMSGAEVEHEDDRQDLWGELEGIGARYKEALDRGLAPVRAKYAELDVRAMKDPYRTEAGNFYKPWAIAEWNVLAKQENAAYEKVCAEWWAASGPFHGWLKRYRAHLDERIPQREEAENVGAGFQVMLVGTPSATFRPVSSLRAVGEFMDQTRKIFENRRQGPVEPQKPID